MNLHDHFTQLNELLHRYEQYWRPFPFQQMQLPWVERHPDLAVYLLALPDASVQRLAADPAALAEHLLPYLPFVKTLTGLCELPQWRQRTLPALSPRRHAGIPGRKLEQIERFAAALPGVDLPILEWCSGKSHLGFMLEQGLGQPVTALEWNADLVAQANQRARQWHCNLQSHQVDVLTPAVEGFLQPAQQIVALHACGDLHLNLLRLAAKHGVQQVQLAPCCYQKTVHAHYQPLSQAAQQAALPLTKQELQLAVMETATAGEYQQRQRLRLQAFRLGFDFLQRQVRNLNEFLPIPSLPGEWNRATFSAFCQHCAQLKGVTLPAQVDWQYYEQKGWQRLREVSALDLVRFLFRRPLEIWLVLDRALFLLEHGYQVEIGTFCQRSATPRNILIVAELMVAELFVAARCKP